MNALVFSLWWFEFSQALLFTSSGSVGGQVGHGDRVSRSLDDGDLRCGAVRAFLQEKGLLEKGRSYAQQEESPVQDAELSMCVTNEPRHSCCTSQTEHQLQVLSFNDMRQVMSSSMTPVRHDLTVAMKSFSDEFRVILRTFENSTFHILANTFRIPAPEVQSLLDSLTSPLLASFSGETGQQLIRKAIGEFYDELFVAAVHNLLKFNVSIDGDRKGRRCLTDLRTDPALMPLGNYPSLFEQHFSRSLGAALTFAWGLQVVSDYLNVTVNLDLAEKCLQGVTRMTYCPLCQGLTNTDPCPAGCTWVMRPCLRSLLGVSGSIRRFADEAIDSVQAELSSVTIFDAVLPSMISESLLKVISTGHMYRNQIVKKCGFRKSNGSASLSSSAIPSTGVKTLRDGDSLRQTLTTLRSILLQVSDLLVALPKTFCKSRNISATSDAQCWNGTSLEPRHGRPTAADEKVKEGEEWSIDMEPIASDDTDTTKQINQITSMLQQIHRKTYAQKTPSKEDAEAGVQMTGGKTQKPHRLRPVKDNDVAVAAATDDEVDVDSDDDNDDQYSGAESGQRIIADMPTPRMKTVIELVSLRPEASNSLSSSSDIIRQSAVTVILGFASTTLVIISVLDRFERRIRHN